MQYGVYSIQYIVCGTQCTRILHAGSGTPATMVAGSFMFMWSFVPPSPVRSRQDEGSSVGSVDPVLGYVGYEFNSCTPGSEEASKG